MSDQMVMVSSMERGDSLQELAMEGQKHLEGTVEAAHDILASLNEVLCNPVLWAQPVPESNSSKPGGVPPQQEQGWLALETGRLRYKSTTAALRSSINNIFSKPQMRAQEGDSGQDKGSGGDLDQLEKQAARLREETTRKNQILKLLIDQSRDLVSDISMWQSAEL